MESAEEADKTEKAAIAGIEAKLSDGNAALSSRDFRGAIKTFTEACSVEVKSAD